MRIAIVGTGGVGGYFGARLIQGGHDVVLTARGAHLDALRNDGLRLYSVDGDVHLPTVQVTEDARDSAPADLIIVAVKTWQLDTVVEIVERLSSPATRVLPLLNGITAHDRLAEILDRERVLGGYCNIVSAIEAPGVIRHFGVVPTINLGVLDATHDAGRASAIRDALDVKGITAHLDQDVRVGLWRKYVFVSSWGGVGSISRAPIGAIRSIPQTRDLLIALIRENCELGRAQGVNLPDSTEAETLSFVDSLPPDSTPSLQRDLHAGRHSELEDWTGAAVRIGAKIGRPVPINQVIYSGLSPLHQRSIGKSEYAFTTAS